MRGLKVRSADALHDWSSAILLDTAPGGVRAYVDAQNLLKLPLAGGTLTGPLNLPGGCSQHSGSCSSWTSTRTHKHSGERAYWGGARDT
jgi:hypothetical protein